MAEDYDAGMYEDVGEAQPRKSEVASSQTALLPVTAFGGKEPHVGKVCKFEVVAIHEDQAEVKYAGSEGDEGYTEPEPEAAPEPAGMADLMA